MPSTIPAAMASAISGPLLVKTQRWPALTGAQGGLRLSGTTQLNALGIHLGTGPPPRIVGA